MPKPLLTTDDLILRPRWSTVILRALTTGIVAGGIAFAITWAVLAWPTLKLEFNWYTGNRPQNVSLALARDTAVQKDHLVIPSIGIDAPVFYNTPYTDAVGQLPDGVVHVDETALPGEVGNTFLIGHSSGYWFQSGQYNQVFALLDKVNSGDTILVNHGGTTFTYRMTSRQIVRPNQVEVLDQPTDQRELSIMTCTPIGTSLNRLIVRAKLIEN